MKSLFVLASVTLGSFALISSALAGDGQDWLKVYKGPNNTVSVFHGDYEFPDSQSPKRVCARETRAEGYVIKCGEMVVPVSFDERRLTVTGGGENEQVFLCRSEYQAKDKPVGTLIARCAEYYNVSTYTVNAFRRDEGAALEGLATVGLDVGMPSDVRSDEQLKITCAKQPDTSYRCASKGHGTQIEILIEKGSEESNERLGIQKVTNILGDQSIKQLRCYAREIEEYGHGSVGCLPVRPAASQIR